jgi:Tfp pilus assembly protein PilO
VQKLASASALGQVQGWVNSDKPIKTEYYMEYPTTYKYLGGFHEFGRFLSNVSGYEKIINISDIVMTRDSGKGRNTAAIEFRLSTYVYDKSQGKPKAPVASAPVAAPSKGKDED